MTTASTALVPYQVRTISYECRDIGYGVESDIIEAYWTGEIDVWGKYTIKPVDGQAPLYLFADEILYTEEP